MRYTLKSITPLFAAGFAAVAIAAAPIAAANSAAQSAAPAPADSQQSPADSQQSCATLGGTQTQCQSPGNAQVYDAPPQVDYFPYAGGGT